MAEEMRGRQGGQVPHQQQGRPRPNVVSPFPFGSPLHQVSDANSLNVLGEQKLCFAKVFRARTAAAEVCFAV